MDFSKGIDIFKKLLDLIKSAEDYGKDLDITKKEKVVTEWKEYLKMLDGNYPAILDNEKFVSWVIDFVVGIMNVFLGKENIYGLLRKIVEGLTNIKT